MWEFGFDYYPISRLAISLNSTLCCYLTWVSLVRWCWKQLQTHALSSWCAWFKFMVRRKRSSRIYFSKGCSSCFSACQDSLAAHYKQNTANIHFSQHLLCPVIKLEALACTICNRAAIRACFNADASRLCCSFCKLWWVMLTCLC